MASISEDLNSYLSRSTSSASLSSVTSKLSSFKLPTLNQIKGTDTNIGRPKSCFYTQSLNNDVRWLSVLMFVPSRSRCGAEARPRMRNRSWA